MFSMPRLYLEQFLGTSYAQLKVGPLYLVGIKSADRVART